MVLFDAESVHDVDTTAVQVLDAAGLVDRIGEGNIYLEVDDGVIAYRQHRDGW